MEDCVLKEPWASGVDNTSNSTVLGFRISGEGSTVGKGKRDKKNKAKIRRNEKIRQPHTFSQKRAARFRPPPFSGFLFLRNSLHGKNPN